MKAVEKSANLELQLIVTGSHLSYNHEHTVDIIKKDGFNIDEEINILVDSDNKSGIATSMGLLMIQLAGTFARLQPDMLLILGDRYEILASASTAVAMNIPIAHIHGGESTEGAIDEQIRHAITKMAHLHFAATETYKNNILKMGEQSFRVFNVGAAIMENIKKRNFMGKDELEKHLGFTIKYPFFIITYHPVTLIENQKQQIENLLEALDTFEGTLLFTASNADYGGDEINKLIEEYASSRNDSYFIKSLNHLYLDVLKHADVMVGNSSSGIVEAPCFGLPVVNVGDRQKGRLRSKNIIDVGYDRKSIKEGIEMALNKEFISDIGNMQNLYGDGKTSEKIVSVLSKTVVSEEFIFKKLTY